MTVRVFASPAALVDAVGEELGTSGWVTVGQSTVDGFAEVTGDHQWIHQAGSAAEDGPFGGPVAHGFLTLSLLIPMLDDIFRVEQASAVINKGVDRLRFTTPVPAGGRVRATATLSSARARVRGFTEVVLSVVAEVEGKARPAYTVDVLMLYQGGEQRPPVPEPEPVEFHRAGPRRTA
ncbi:Acyl dehydratase [Lentzea fradiae]|uniref:Acyl dehydratase n=1 Tax=Lentzea fradiae TaxID=200378 RepID=A0A1G8CMU0_9PSEU|nr:MaoC family dehydratase [Lentzea fradiae]SDH46684.1 Acyl dehydratase [Lentzea fradiae]